MAMARKKKLKIYTDQEKIAAILLLKKNSFNYTKTAKQCGCRFESLKKWRWQEVGRVALGEENKGAQIEESKRTKLKIQGDQVEVVKQDFYKKEMTLNDRIFHTKELILRRIEDVLPSIKSAHALATLWEVVKEEDGERGSPENKFSAWINNLQINQNNGNEKTDSADTVDREVSQE